MGPWKPINLHMYNTRIVDLDIRTEVSESFDILLKVDCNLSSEFLGSASFFLDTVEDRHLISHDDLETGEGRFYAEFCLTSKDVELWFPVGYGNQPLYAAVVQIVDQVCLPVSPWPIMLTFGGSGESFWTGFPRGLPSGALVSFRRSSSTKMV